MAVVTAKCVHQQRYQLRGVDRAKGEGKVGPSDRRGTEEWWGHSHPLSTFALLGGGQSLVRCQKHGGL